jgi:hypothetical protein
MLVVTKPKAIPMGTLEDHHIIDLYCLVDRLISTTPKPLGGRPQILSDAEVVTILLWNGLTVQQHTLKDIWKWVVRERQRDFPALPGYKGFISHCHRLVPTLALLLKHLLTTHHQVRLVDSTMLPVCKLSRANTHKVAQGVAAFGKNGSGWHFGFKLHAGFTPQGALAAFCFTPANESDLMQLPRLVAEHSLVVGDAGYTAQVMRSKLWKEKRCLIVSPPRQKQHTQLLASWQYALLKLRQKAECGFDQLKEHLHLVTSFPRSVSGYFLHYLQALLTYQLQVEGF